MADEAWDERLLGDPSVSSSLFPECTSEHHPLVDDLALVAVGENLPGELERHILECPPCLEAAAAWAALADLAAFGNSTADIPAPGSDVWSSIGAELTLAGAGPGGGSGSGPSGPEGPRPPAEPAAGVGTVSETDTPATDVGVSGPVPVPVRVVDHPVTAGATVVPLRTRRPLRSWLVPVAAAAAGVALAVGAAVVAQQPGEDQLQAVADLSVVPGGPLSGDANLGSAELMTTANGEVVRVAVADLPDGARSYEVWLFDGDGDMVSLGSLRDGQGVFVVPAGVSTADFRTVDVSDEPGDGNPAHSGISVVRGTFT